ncbi:MAG: hypothetical protein J0I09_11690 [Sphingobacteriia bacterium]|nr:hypothetical protein [Sphingobacteriia bacterium]
MNQAKNLMPKGYYMEELLRNYFLRAGYYVVRGVPFIYEGFDITDIDLWLYSRTSSVAREITLVDSKNKKTPQAIERIFWIQGLRFATKATNAIVATTERRQEVKKFGKELGVVVLDGSFLKKLVDSNSGSNRISDEELYSLIASYTLSKLDGDWKGRLKFSKSLLAYPLSFDSCNEWLEQGRFFVEQSITNKNHREVALRCLYLICSFIALSVDYCMKEISFYETLERSRLLKEGFTYGSKGNEGINNILKLAIGLIEENINDGSVIARKIKINVENQLAKLNTDVLGEYFSSNEVAKNLFSVAKEFEQIAMNKEFSTHNNASLELRSMLFCLLDYWGINRVAFSQ